MFNPRIYWKTTGLRLTTNDQVIIISNLWMGSNREYVHTAADAFRKQHQCTKYHIYYYSITKLKATITLTQINVHTVDVADTNTLGIDLWI